MKIYIIAPILLLAACGGLSREKFYKDKENAAKSAELASLSEWTSDCDNLEKLDKFVKLENPTADDLEEILPLFGIEQKDFKNLDKIYRLDSTVIDKYQCKSNRLQLQKTAEKYCSNKYYDEYALETLTYFPFRLVSITSLFTIVGAIPFALHSCGIESAVHPIACQRKLDCDKFLSESIGGEAKDYSHIDKEFIKNNFYGQVNKIYPWPNCPSFIADSCKYFQLTMSYNDIFAAANEKLGDYHGEYSTDREISRLDAAYVLQHVCNDYPLDNWGLSQSSEVVEGYDWRTLVCVCLTGEAYKDLTIKNVYYLIEKDSIPPSKHTEYTKIINNCKPRVKKWGERVSKELQKREKQYNQNRYGE